MSAAAACTVCSTTMQHEQPPVGPQVGAEEADQHGGLLADAVQEQRGDLARAASAPRPSSGGVVASVSAAEVAARPRAGATASSSRWASKQADERRAVGHRPAARRSWNRGADARHAAATRRSVRRCRSSTACGERRRLEAERRVDRRRAPRSSGAGSTAASTTAAISASLSAKTRKIVPSAMPGGLGDLAGRDHLAVLEEQRAGWRSMIAARRSSGGQGARPLALDRPSPSGRGYLSEHSLTQVAADRRRR